MGNGISEQRVGALFTKLDKNGDGQLKLEELGSLAEICGLSDSDLDLEYKKADHSKDGCLNLQEAIDLFKALKLDQKQFDELEKSLVDILFVIPNATVVTMKGTTDQKRNLLAKGDMQAIKLDGNRFALNIGASFCYVLESHIPSVRIARLFYCVPTGQGEDEYYGIVMPAGTDDDLLETLDDLLSDNTTFEGYYSKTANNSAAPEQEQEGQGAAQGLAQGAAVGAAVTSAKSPSKIGSFIKSVTSKASKAIKDVKDSETYKKASARVSETVDRVKSSETYQKAAEKAGSKYEQLKETKTYQKAVSYAKKGSEIAKEKTVEAIKYTKEVIKSQEGKSVGDKISKGVGVVTDAAVVGIDYTAKFAAATVRETAKLLKKSLKPAKKEKKVSDKTKGYVKTAAKWSGKAVVVSAHAASTALAVADALGKKLTEAIEASSLYQDNKHKMSNPAVQDTKKVVKAGIIGSFRIMDAMIDAGLLFIAEVTVAAAEVAEHTQGEEVGNVAKDASTIVNNTAKAGANFRYVGLTPLAKRAVLGTTIEMLGTEEEKKAIREGQQDNTSATLAVNLALASAAASS